MTGTLIAPVETTAPTERPARVDAAIARRAFHQLWIGATVCGVVFGATIASSAITYAATFPTQLAREQLAAATRGDAGLSVLLGPIDAINTVPGYAVYKSFVFLTMVGAIWAILAATRLLRGEEDSGRWALVLAGRTRATNATTATLAGLGAAIALVFVLTTGIVVLTCRGADVGFDIKGSVVFGASLVLVPAVFAAVAACTSQLGRTRRMATGLALGVFGVAFVLRMVGDASAGTHWVMWLTPFGWSEMMAPLTRNDLWPLLPAVATVAVLSAAAVLLSGRRDVGGSLLAAHDTSTLRPFGLRSDLGLAVRLEGPVLTAWLIGVAGGSLFLGIVAKLTTSLSSAVSFTDNLEKFGVHGSFTNQYLGVAFLLVGTIVGLLPASQIGAAAAEETSGRIVHIVTRPPRRASWLAGRLALAAVAVVIAGILAGAAAWAGVRSQGIEADLGSTLGAGLNVIPTALVALGIGAVVLSFAPRAAAGAVYGIVIWSVLVDLLASMVSSISWLDHTSLFHFMALAPAEAVDPVTIVSCLGVAAMLCGAAVTVFHRRDLRRA